MLAYVVKAILPVGIRFFVRVKDMIWIHNIFCLAEIAEYFWAVHLLEPWATNQTVVVLAA